MKSLSGFMHRIDDMPNYLRWISYTDYIRFGMESSLPTVYGYDRCLKVSKEAEQIDWLSMIPTKAIERIVSDYNNNVTKAVNPTQLLGLIELISGKEGEDTMSIAMTSFGVDDDNLYKGIAMLVVLVLGFYTVTYLFLFKKVRKQI